MPAASAGPLSSLVAPAVLGTFGIPISMVIANKTPAILQSEAYRAAMVDVRSVERQNGPESTLLATPADLETPAAALPFGGAKGDDVQSHSSRSDVRCSLSKAASPAANYANIPS